MLKFVCEKNTDSSTGVTYNRELRFGAVLCGRKLACYSIGVSEESAVFVFRPELSNFVARGRTTNEIAKLYLLSPLKPSGKYTYHLL